MLSGDFLPNLQATGRFQTTAEGMLCCAWSGSQIALRFEGTAVEAVLHDYATGKEGNFIAILIDDAPPATLALKPGTTTYRLAENLSPGEHTLRLFKQTEASVGQIAFGKIMIENGISIPPAPRPDRRIEFIGDSITCGYGNEAPNETEPFKPSTENHYLSYGQLTARALKAECHVVAWSGEGILRNAQGDIVHPMPSIYGQILPPQPEPTWDFAQWIPQVVVINLGTNDFLTGIPDREKFISTYLSLVEKLNGLYRSPHIFCCLGPMITGEHLAIARSYLQELETRAKEHGIPSLHPLEFNILRSDEYGADWHPNLSAHRCMAKTLTEAVQQKMAW